MIFADTGALYAATVPGDPQHGAAMEWIASCTEELVTTDYVIDELLTLMKARGQFRRALTAGRRLFDDAEGDVAIEWVGRDDVRHAWQTYQRYQDKGWSFTDCVSRVVMERLGIATAFAFDAHFRQFGTVRVVPDA